MRVYSREEWGAASPKGRYTRVARTVHATVHHSASPITASAPSAAERPPRKPGAKWYRIWRTKTTGAVQRRAVSRMIRKYNANLKKWKASGTPFIPENLIVREMQIMRGFQAFHQGPQREWVDIGYHFVIFASGNVYIGRPAGVYGAHAAGANDTVGICFVMMDEQPSIAMLDSFHDLITDNKITSFRGHRQRPGNPTTCPGDTLMRVLGMGA